MSQGTICPCLLHYSEAINPSEFEGRFITQFQSHIENCDSLNIEMMISGPIIDLAMNNYPWSRMEDQEWKQWILDWMAAVLPELERRRIEHPLPSSQISEEDDTLPRTEEPTIWRLWKAFLEWWGNENGWNNKCLKGVGAYDGDAACGSHEVCNKFYLIPPSEWRFIKHPWLLRYDPDLPIDGEYPFVPPTLWKSAQLHGNQHGFLDAIGNEWKWDSLHKDHWDVQLPGGGHKNVSRDGRILWQ